MTKEMETRKEISERVEILPESIGKIPALEAAPLLARASSRIQTLGWKGEFWDGVRENLEGASAWTKVNKSNLVNKTLSAVTGVSLLTLMVSACTNGQGPVTVPSETNPRTIEVSPTATEARPTETPTPTETTTPTEIPLPPYWQCGPKIYPNSEGSVEEEAKVLPTGLISKEEFTDLTYLREVTARTCLTELNDVPDPLFPGLAIRGKVIFFDLDGKTHEYNIMIGGADNYGGERRTSLVYFDPGLGGVAFHSMLIKDALPILEKFYNNSEITASRQIDIDFATKDLGAPWILGKYINQNREFLVKLIEALKTGRGFSEDVPKDFFLYVSQIKFMPGFAP